VKRIKCTSKREVQRTERELQLHKKFGEHPHIIPLISFVAEEDTAGGYRFSLVFPFYKVRG
jgi:hypothetical protein